MEPGNNNRLVTVGRSHDSADPWRLHKACVEWYKAGQNRRERACSFRLRQQLYRRFFKNLSKFRIKTISKCGFADGWSKPHPHGGDGLRTIHSGVPLREPSLQWRAHKMK